ncbi:MAG: DUF1566 domain-containing protein [Desulfobacterales bacterium]|nr:DUF1566 domain-containing protein [Desulfobacterales bacterium]
MNFQSLPINKLPGKIVRILLLCCMAVVCAIPIGLLTAAEKDKVGSGTNHALIVGINGYTQWPTLKSPVKDAHRIAYTLAKKYNFSKANITLLTDKTREKPTLINILTAIEGYLGSLKENDNLLIFFAGQSYEDDEGETYWIPIDGKKTSKLTWLKHSTIISEYLGSNAFKAKSLLILADSHFSAKLVRSRSISLTPYDLRYPEKIIEKASRRSREVIAFGDQHWPGNDSTDNFGLFTYYIDKALSENQLEIIDFENLIFDENIMLPIQKVAGVRMLQGRLRKTKMDKGGQFVIAKLEPAVLIDIIASTVSPEKGYPGDPFTVTAQTSMAASEVTISINNKKYRMHGSGSQWAYNGIFKSPGTAAFSIAAINRNDQSGKLSSGKFTAIKKRAEAANIVAASVSPSTGGFGGDRFTFQAKTDRPARKVAVRIGKEYYSMKGSGTTWKLDQVVNVIGRIPFTVIATNAEGVQGKIGDGTLQTRAGPANILAATASPKTGYAGEEFLLQAKTDRPAKSVSLKIGGQVFQMKGSGKTWQLKKAIPDIGKKSFTVTAINPAGIAGRSGQGTLTAKKSPLPIPDVLSVDVAVVAPGKGYPGDRFTIRARTSAPSDRVLLQISGKQYTMRGNRTNWTYVTQADLLGQNPYRVSAMNKDHAQGKSWEGFLTTIKKPADIVNIVSGAVNPKKGRLFRKFQFTAQTDRPAKSVALVIGEQRFRMIGSGTKWSLQKKLEQEGALNVSLVALNADNVAGRAKGLAVTTFKRRYAYNRADGTVTDLLNKENKPRFKDNGNKTYTDLMTGLVWLEQPKQIALPFDKAVAYCSNLKLNGKSGWRLPTLREWKQLVDKRQQNPALPPGNPFDNVITHVGYWSKSRHKFGPQYVYQMSLWYGKPNHLKKNANAVVWPVRYALEQD